jgi:lipopolysaccharide export system permease protein
VQRQVGSSSADAAIVVFERYAFDLSQFIDAVDTTRFKPRERYTSELINPDPKDPVYKSAPGRFRSELVERVVAPLYPIAFAFVALAALGQARTTRQSRGTAVATAIVSIIAIRVGGFAAQSLSVRTPMGVALALAIPVVASLASLAVILGWARPRMPQALSRFGFDVLARLPRPLRARA